MLVTAKRNTICDYLSFFYLEKSYPNGMNRKLNVETYIFWCLFIEKVYIGWFKANEHCELISTSRKFINYIIMYDTKSHKIDWIFLCRKGQTTCNEATVLKSCFCMKFTKAANIKFIVTHGPWTIYPDFLLPRAAHHGCMFNVISQYRGPQSPFTCTLKTRFCLYLFLFCSSFYYWMNCAQLKILVNRIFIFFFIDDRKFVDGLG